MNKRIENFSIFFFTNEDKENISKLLNNEESTNSLKHWYIYAVIGNLVPIIIARVNITHHQISWNSYNNLFSCEN